jgi:site-specific recombinase XerD
MAAKTAVPAYTGAASRGSRRTRSGHVSHKASVISLARMENRVDPLLGQFETYLEASGKSLRTVRTYMVAVRQLEAFIGERGLDWHEVTPLDCQAWIAEVVRKGASASWRNQCVSAGKGLFGFLEEYLWDGEHRSPMARMKTARVPRQPKSPLPDERLAAVIAACKEEPDRFVRRRDEAIFRLLLDSGIRRAECAAIQLADLDIARGRVRILGKGAKLRHAAFGMKTGMALRRYLQARQGHPRAALDALWLGKQGPLTASGIYGVISSRGRQAGVPLHPHRLRSSWAVRAEVDLVDLMALAGWESADMARRYKSEGEAERAIARYSRSSVGDRF